MSFDGEEIALSPGRCYFKEQDVAGSKITATAQATGTNAAGEEVLVDFSRYKESSFADPGDDVTVTIGPLGNSEEYGAYMPLDTVSVSDDNVSVGESTFSSFDDGSKVVGSVTIEC